MEIKRGGAQRLEVFRDGKCIHDTGIIPNMLLNGYFDRLTSLSGPIFSGDHHCLVGSGAVAVNPSNVSLGSFIAATKSVVVKGAYNGISDGYVKYSSSRKFSFPIGAVIGNISEVGTIISRSGTSTSLPLDTRAVLPSTVTVTASDQLVVTHIKNVWFPSADSTGVLVLNGNNYNYVIRATNANTSGVLEAALNENLFSTFAASGAFWGYHSFSAATLPVTAGGPLTGTNYFRSDAPAVTKFAPPSLLVSRFNLSWSISMVNIPGGIDGFVMLGNGNFLDFLFYLQFTPKIPKLNTQQLMLQVQIVHSRI